MVDTVKKDAEKSTTSKVDEVEKKEEPEEEERVVTIEEGQSCPPLPVTTSRVLTTHRDPQQHHRDWTSCRFDGT
jgi:hypothetical protein